MPELLGLPYSPWSEKARWPLVARGISYTSRTYQPLIGEPALRFKLGKWTGVVTVPVFTADGETLSDSADIARWADRHGEGPTFFPAGEDDAIARFIALSDRGLEAGRALSLMRLLEDPEGLVEMVPRSLRKMPGAVSVAAMGIRRTLRKYRAGADRAEHEATLASVLEELRASLADSPSKANPKTLLEKLTFADVVMAQVLAFVSPPSFGLRLGKATRKSFIDEGMSARFPDLLAWRDALYETHRPRPT